MSELNQAEDIRQLTEKVREQNYFFTLLKQEINKAIIGQEYMVDRLLIGLLGNGHVLLEGVPGLAKTLAIKTLADAVHGAFSRIQFTPDLLPADVVGTMIYSIKDNDFSIKKGPIFANFVLADEINRAPSKVQSALLEAMQEKQVTIGDETMSLPKPFLVLATQNPIDQEGTYLLPEAQSDRFMLKCVITYPDFEDERKIMNMVASGHSPEISPVITLDNVTEAKKLINQIYLDEKIEKYILDMVFATRFPEKYGLSDLKNYISFGASPRASINLSIAARAMAFLKNRAFVIPEDVKEIAKDVLRHRIGLSFEAEAEEITADQIVDKIVAKIQAP
ncbi:MULTISPECIES: MoxR family ATPase [unclassified Kaistella]|uniref:AAA family ATPase n=1 Tax=unclassified Kaistella TaxID=2762626 RepID=UPI00273416D0|nr:MULTISPECIES: MoxR family ATPase [unclassified Kaistella]MDP2453718.1 MoxR family ATPase [Kaistella sp. SH11-4b]MDP2456775.1 MoxR family ATPase [Kaistella sp. SH40-3]MDP2459531.1 MoxR family ATPase [Kaistella sp. SH19-2b]